MAMFAPSLFDNETYRPQIPGWLQQIQNTPAVVPGQFDDAALPPNARPAAGMLNQPMDITPQMPQRAAQPQQQPNFMDKLGAGLAGFFQGGGTLSGALQSSAQGFETGRTPQNQTVAALTKRGLEPELAAVVARDPALLRSVLAAQIRPQQSNDIVEFEYARKNGFKGGFEDWIANKRAGAGEYGMQPIWGTDAQGNPAVVQLGKSGQAVQSKLPTGFQVARDPIKVDAGTHFNLIDPQTRQVIRQVPKDLAGAESQKEQGTAQGKAAVALPTVISKADQSLKLIDDMINHPGRETATGLSGLIDPTNYFPGSQGKDFQIRQRQLQGRTFLEAFESLKGAGAITEIEGAKAEQAIARLDLAQSDNEYLAALKELKVIINNGIKLARTRAGVQPSTPTAGVPVGETRNLKEKYGLD